MTDNPNPAWRITVDIPMSLADTERERLFVAVADAVHGWEPPDRDGWDASVSAGLLADPAQTTELAVPLPIAAVGEEKLEPLVSTATTARRRVVQVAAQPSELEEAQRSARFWREQAEGWEHAHQNTVLPYATKLEDQRDRLSLLLRGMARGTRRFRLLMNINYREVCDAKDVIDQAFAERDERQAHIDAATAELKKWDALATRESEWMPCRAALAALVGDQGKHLGENQAKSGGSEALTSGNSWANRDLALSGEALRAVEEAADAAGDLP